MKMSVVLEYMHALFSSACTWLIKLLIVHSSAVGTQRAVFDTWDTVHTGFI